jgi:hypothetical protein
MPDEPLPAATVADLPEIPTAVAPPAAVREAETAEAKLLRATPLTSFRKVSKAKPRRPVAAPRRPRTAAEKDFLERQGYIY